MGQLYSQLVRKSQSMTPIMDQLDISRPIDTAPKCDLIGFLLYTSEIVFNFKQSTLFISIGVARIRLGWAISILDLLSKTDR